MQLLVAATVEDQWLRLGALPKVLDRGDVQIVIARCMYIDDARNDVGKAVDDERDVLLMVEAGIQIHDRLAGKMCGEILLCFGKEIDPIAIADREVMNDARFAAQ